MPTNKREANRERQRKFRQRMKDQGLTQVSGLYAPPELHAKIKRMVREFVNRPNY